MSRSLPCLFATVVLAVTSTVSVVSAGWNEDDGSTDPIDSSEYLSASVLSDGSALLVGQWAGVYEGLDGGDADFRVFVQYRNPDGDIVWTTAVAPGETCDFEDGRVRRDAASGVGAFFVVETCTGSRIISADAAGIRATIALEAGTRVESFDASGSGFLHVVAEERALVGGLSATPTLSILDSMLSITYSTPVPSDIIPDADPGAALGVGNLVSSSGEAWLVGIDGKGPGFDDDVIALVRVSATDPDLRVEHRPNSCYLAAGDVQTRPLQVVDGQLWVAACETATDPGAFEPRYFVLAFDESDGSLLGEIPIPLDMPPLAEDFFGEDVIQFSTDGRLARTSSSTGAVLWRIDGALGDTTWDKIALSGDINDDGARVLLSFDRVTETEYIAAGWHRPPSLTDEFGSGPHRASIVRRELPPLTGVDPARLLETRAGQPTIDGSKAGIGRLPADSTTTLPVVGRGGVLADAEAVMVNVTAIDPEEGGFVTIHPCDAPRAETSSLNYAAGVTTGNTVVSLIGAAGDICIFTSAATDLVVDASGFLRPLPSFGPMAPARMTDSRVGKQTVDGEEAGTGRLAAGETREVAIAGRAGVAADADSIIVNVTAVNPAETGFVTLFPCDESQPATSSLNFGAGQIAGNQAIVDLSASGRLCAFASTATDLTIDATAWLGAEAGLRDRPALRYLDTRPNATTFDDRFFAGGPFEADSTTPFAMLRGPRDDGLGTLRLALLNVTVVRPEADGFITLFPCGQLFESAPRPIAASVNFVAGENAGNTVLLPIPDGDGVLCVYSSARTDAVIDVVAAR